MPAGNALGGEPAERGGERDAAPVAAIGGEKAGRQSGKPRQVVEGKGELAAPAQGEADLAELRVEHVGVLRREGEEVEPLAVGEAAAAADDEAPGIVAPEIDAEMRQVGDRHVA